MDTPRRALVILAEGAEEMETTVIVDVLRRAGIEVVLAGLDGPSPVVCSRGIRIVPDVSLDEIEAGPESARLFDAIVLPGGAAGAERLATSERVGAWLERHHGAGKVVAAICAAPLALAAHGILEGRAYTCHPAVGARLEGRGVYLRDERVVEDGAVVTSQGPGTTFEFALTLVARLAGKEVQRRVEGPLLLPAPTRPASG